MLLPFVELLLAVTVYGQGSGVPVVSPATVPASQQDYNLIDNYCWLLAHQSVLLGDQIIIDGGMAKYEVILQSAEHVFVPDFNGNTVFLSLKSSFRTDSPPLSRIPKDLTVPVVSRGSIWVDSTRKTMTIQGGHFYNQPNYNESRWFVNKTMIPGYTMWELNFETETWEEITPELTIETPPVYRAFGGAGASVTDTNVSYYIGGYYNPQTSKDWPAGYSMTQNGMLIYDHTTHTLRNETLQGYGDNEGFWHGVLQPLKPGCGKGMLLSLMAEKATLGEPLPFVDGTGVGTAVDFKNVMLYDIENGHWYNQTSSFWEDEKPITRTRFCGDIVHDPETDSWDLWIFGGQQMENQDLSVEDIWVLTMPAFVWVKIPVSKDNPLRSHTCHAVGKHLIIIGGGVPGKIIDQEAPCDTSMIKIFNMNDEPGPKWLTEFTPGTTYVQPDIVRRSADLSPRKGWASPRVQELFVKCISPPIVDKPGKTEKGPGNTIHPGIIAGATVGGILGLLAAIAAVVLLVRWRRNRGDGGGGDDNYWGGGRPIHDPNGQEIGCQELAGARAEPE